ncbi:MAG TPA: DUF1385 domain-containing protein [Egibacteraceae bacterium]|nr:DUF1385 domain-containing protein [Egibacteraceae bacterium]
MTAEKAPDAADSAAPEEPRKGAKPHYYGGQALIEGVMMRGAEAWAVAVRRPSGDIYLERHPVSDFPKRRPLFAKPMFRGMYGLVDALSIGTRALGISANQSVEDHEQLSGRQMGGSLALAALLFIGIFVVLPNVGLAFVSGRIGDGWLYHLVEGVVRMGIFLAYLFAISLLADIRRVFQYHGAEHKTIAAWEHGENLTPDAVSPYSTLHVRCGTNFLLMVMLIAIVTYSTAGWLIPVPEGGAIVKATYHIALRLALLPVVAGLAYEGLRLGAGRDNWFVRMLMKPGLWLQMVTTKPPSQDQIEVAIRAFEAVVPARTLAGRNDPTLPSGVVWGPDEATEHLGLADVTGAVISDNGRDGGRGELEEEPTSES